MKSYIFRKTLEALLLILGVTFLIFFIINLSTDGFKFETTFSPEAYPFQYAEYRASAGVEKSVILRYFDWLSGVLQGDLGKSTRVIYRSIGEIISIHLPKSFILVFEALFFSIIVSIPLGVSLAIWSSNPIAKWLNGILTLGVGIPSFIPSLLTIYLLAVQFNMLPVRPAYLSMDKMSFIQIFLAQFKFSILPTVGLSIGVICTLTSFIRTSLLEVFKKDYIRTARAKGLTTFKINFKHALKNAAIPWITMLGMAITVLLSELFIVEKIFSWPGITKRLIEALVQKDYHLVMGVSLYFTGVIVCINLAVDLGYGWLNPKIHYA